MLIKIILAGLAGYLIGSVSFGILISRMAHNDDIRKHGSGNAGMTNALRVYGGKTAVWVFLGDFLKGALAVLVGGLIVPGGQLAAALMVIVGHLFPVFFSFKGGKGVATAAGAILVLSPVTLLVLVVPFGLILLTTRYMSLASVVVAGLFPVVTALLLWLGGGISGAMQWAELCCAVLIGGLVIYMHRANIGRLIKGTESKLGQKAK